MGDPVGDGLGWPLGTLEGASVRPRSDFVDLELDLELFLEDGPELSPFLLDLLDFDFDFDFEFEVVMLLLVSSSDFLFDFPPDLLDFRSLGASDTFLDFFESLFPSTTELSGSFWETL